jgi:hypothetical protein
VRDIGYYITRNYVIYAGYIFMLGDYDWRLQWARYVARMDIT